MSDPQSNVPEIRKSPDGQGDDRYAVVLPCSTAEFGSFISGLLGEPQIIYAVVPGPFVVERHHINNLHSLIQQRIFQQNESSLVQWTITIEYDDNSSVRLDSLKEFDDYAEVKSHVSIAFNMHFVYLIKFRDQKIPSKQSIDITFSAGRRRLFNSPGRGCGFSIRIEHTARSWGVDIESLLVGHLSTLPRLQYSKSRLFISKYSTKIQPIVGFGFFLISLIGLLYRIDQQGKSAAAELLAKLSKLSDQQKLVEAVNITALQIANGSVQKNFLISVVFTVFLGVGSIFIAFLIEQKFDINEEGALLLTKDADAKFRILKSSESKFLGAVVLCLHYGSIERCCRKLYLCLLHTMSHRSSVFEGEDVSDRK